MKNDITSLQQNDVPLPTDTIKTDSVSKGQTYAFDNVLLENMLQSISAYYQTEVEFQDEEVRQLRFYFVWRKDEPIESVIDRLNKFKSVDVKLNGNKITVK